MDLKTIHIGVGGRGQWPFKIREEKPPFRPVALVDTLPENLNAARELTGLPSASTYSDAEQAIEETRADAVVICTPTALHGRFCRLAFSHGKHVLVEKAMTNSWSDAKALVSEADAAGVKLCVVQNLRYFQAFRAAADILKEPMHPLHPGDVRMVDFMQHRNRPNPKHQIYPFAMVWDMGVHHMDTLVALNGPVENVHACTYSMPWSKYPHPTNINAVISFTNGAMCNYLLTHDSRHQEMRFVMQGEKGSIRYAGLSSSSPSELHFHPSGSRGMSEVVECPFPPHRDPSGMVMEDFCHYVQSDVEPGISGKNNLETLRACQMLCLSAEQGRNVHRSEID